MENNGYKEIEDYVDYDVYGMIGARSKKLPNGDKDWFAAICNGLVTWSEYTGPLLEVKFVQILDSKVVKQK